MVHLKGELFSFKIATLINEEDILIGRVIEAKVKCDDFQATYRSIVGSREKRLTDALESIKVVRQAYGNVMVGNHCVIFLKKYLVLTTVIEDHIVAREHFNEIFSLLAVIMNLVMAQRFLTEEECNDFVKVSGENFQSSSHTEK